MKFDKAFAIDELAKMIKQHLGVAAGMDAARVKNYIAASPFARGMARYYGIDEAMLVTALCCFDFQWGQDFKQQTKSDPDLHDWGASYYDRANAFADRLGALKPYDNPKQEMRGEYRAAFDAPPPADGDLPPFQPGAISIEEELARR